MMQIILFLTAFCLSASAAANVHAETYSFYASQSGKPTYDVGDNGGNPFASALVDILSLRGTTLGQLPQMLRSLTIEKSRGYQRPDMPSTVTAQDWRLDKPVNGEKRIALILVISDYTEAGVNSLLGAASDAKRISRALKDVGFEIEEALDLPYNALASRIKEFRSKSSEYDVGLIYVTGHGLEYQDTIYLLPSDYPVPQGNTALQEKAFRISEIAKASHAKALNLIFYAGCRDHPFGK